MQPLIELARKAAERIRSEPKLIHVVSHNDADGISSAAIMVKALLHLGKLFHLIIVKQIRPELIERLRAAAPGLVVFTDIGSGYLDELEKLGCDVIVADHHEMGKVWTGSGLIHVNPELFGIKNISGSVVSYLMGRELTGDTSAATLAVVGAVGDLTNIDPAVLDSPHIQTEKGLKIYGRFSRPLHAALASTGIDEAAALQLLAELGIAPQDSGGWRTLADLGAEERQRLTDALVREKLKCGRAVEELFDDVWTLKGWPGELADAREFATLLNACGRLDHAAVGVAICLGSTKALELGRELLGRYKKMIAGALDWLAVTPSAMRRTGSANYILAGNMINENIIGAVVSMISRSSDFEHSPLIGLADAEDGVKVSGRCNGLNINKIISQAAAEIGGSGGGHSGAAGATIPSGSEERFIGICDGLLGQKPL